MTWAHTYRGWGTNCDSRGHQRPGPSSELGKLTCKRSWVLGGRGRQRKKERERMNEMDSGRWEIFSLSLEALLE